MIAVHPGPYVFPAFMAELPSGRRIRYYESRLADNGPTLLFIHGLGNYAQVWFKLMDQLKGRFRCIALDLPGHGDSPETEQVENISTFAEVVEALVAHLRLENYLLVGHSMGGLTAMRALLRGKLFPVGLVLLAPAGFEVFSPKDQAWLSSIYSPGILAKLGRLRMEEQFRGNFHHFPADAEAMLADITTLKNSEYYLPYCSTLAYSARAIFAETVSEELAGIELPTLVYYGLADAMVPHRVLHPDQRLDQICRSAVEKMPQARLELLSDTGHMLQWEVAERIGSGIVSFVNDLAVK
ncbi:MAG: pimeloyl-ACP methyl ester carboxylesterase [Neolewinella sp.]|jgi:pimeloyl-ACP methyl ester carboxylesterase